MYVDQFENNEDVAEQYAKFMDEEDKARILKLLNESIVHVAYYGRGSYDGTSLVIFEHNGILYEVNASHCSCYGLEGQWCPEETNWKAIGMREFSDYYDGEQTVKQFIAQKVKELS
jgi:hypothetical protein